MGRKRFAQEQLRTVEHVAKRQDIAKALLRKTGIGRDFAANIFGAQIMNVIDGFIDRLTITESVVAPGTDNILVVDGTTHFYPHGLDTKPIMFFIQKTIDAGATWSPLNDDVVGWNVFIDATHIQIINASGLDQTVRIRVLG